MPELDKKSQMLLWSLYQDSRAPLSNLAKTIKTSKSNTLKRLKKLHQGFIKKYLVGIDTAKVGFPIWSVFLLRFSKITPSKEKEVLTYLADRPFSTMVIRGLGDYDVVSHFIVKDNLHLREIIKDLENHFEGIIAEQVVLDLSEECVWRAKFLFDKEPLQKIIDFSAPAKQYRIDSTEFALLNSLEKNARISYVDISKEIGISPELVRFRFKKLMKAGVISFIDFVPDYEKMGVILFQVFVSFSSIDKIKAGLRSYCQASKSIDALSLTTGQYNVILTGKVKNFLEVRTVLSELKEKFGEHMKQYNLLFIYDVQKATYLPKGIVLDN